VTEEVSTPEGASLRDALAAAYDSQGGNIRHENDPGEPEKPEMPEPEGDEPETPEPEAAELEDHDEPEGLEAPEHWSQERKELFARVDPDVQQAWIDREAEYERGIQQKAQEAASYRQAIEPIKQHLHMRGMSETQWIQQMAAYTDALERDPLGVIKAVAQQYGVDLGNLDQGSDEFVDPQVKGMQDQIRELERQIRESQQTAQQQQASAQEQAIAAFRDETDAQGNKAHPHFDAVSDDMLILANGYVAAQKPVPPLKELYERAARAAGLDQQKAQVQDLDKAKKAKRARSAAASARSTVASGDKPKPKTLKDELNDAWDQLARS